MLGEIGLIVRDIRQSKNLKSSYVYKGIFSRQASSNFEKGLNDTTVKKFFIILERLNISLEEFHIALTKNKSNQFQLFSEISKYFYKNDMNSLVKIMFEMEEKYTIKNNIKYLHYKIMIGQIINTMNKKEQTDDFDILRNYLVNCNSWGYYEIVLFGNCLNYFSQEFIDIVYYRIKKNLNQIQNFNRYTNELAKLLLNIIFLNIKRGDYTCAKKYLVEYNTLSLSLENDSYYNIMRKFFNSLMDVLCKQSDTFENLEKILNILEFLELDNKKKQCISLLESLNFKVNPFQTEHAIVYKIQQQ
ncbi:Rgg family transcriptional regulator [Lysinibacillus piscis]|uniref:Transcriptional regulator n=1 Tax=Lysinibacillus piscis TaxID=2518931 RepID=A0ABQ5NMD3_9BACI|nr:hypothetical protein [Lysinibacillus sp. KH24]GLC89468.1 transcriptional regulator [Lysinibacillus sp. KH24]